MQALEAVEKALACNPSNSEMQRKARDLRRKTGGSRTSLPEADKENHSCRQNNKESEGPSQAQDRQPLKVTPVNGSILLQANMTLSAWSLPQMRSGNATSAGTLTRTPRKH